MKADSKQDLNNFLEQFHSALHGAYENGRSVIFGGDLNLQIDSGKRGEQFANLCSGFRLIITNDDDHHDPLVDTWTFCRSVGIKRRIDFITSSRSVCLLGSSATDLLNLGSDHRAVRATYLIGSKPKKVPHEKHPVERGWKPTLDSCGCPFFFSLAPFSANVSGSDCFTGQSPGTRRTRRAKVQGPLSYHEMLHAELGHEPQSLFELESLCCRASAQENKAATKRPGQKVIYDDVFHALLAERRRTRSKSQRAKLSKFIRKHLRRAFREHRNGRTEHVLDEFKDLDRLPHYARAPVHPCSTTGGEECPGPDEFATFLENIFASEIGLESPHLITVVREIEATGFRETSHHG